MRISAVLHLLEDGSITGELDGPPDTAAHFVTVYNPRRRDSRAAPFLDNNPETVLIAWHRISYIQLTPEGDVDSVIGFVRE